SHMILTTTRQPNLLYRDRRWQKRARYLSQPGFRGGYPPALSRKTAHQMLGIDPTTTFVYLCLAHLHIERELIFLLEAFQSLTQGNRSNKSLPNIQLLLVGYPADGQPSQRLLKLVEHDSAICFHDSAYRLNDLPQYMGACDTLVLPHLAVHTSGSLENAGIALSYERFVVAPDLPRFSGMLPHRASVPYMPGSRESLAEALVKVQQIDFALLPDESAALDFQQSWENYTHSLFKIYRELLGQTPS
ncbi:MAG: glycosyltransferase, partial [Ktedonobacteraceae bacterium]